MNTLDRLLQKLDEKQAEMARLDNAYAGKSPMAYLSPEAKEALGERMGHMGSNIPRLAVTCLTERLRVIGFKTNGTRDDALWATWLRNDLDQWATTAHREALALGRAYALVWVDRLGRATVSVESARQVAHITDPGTREIVAAVKRWETPTSTEAVVFEPDLITRYRADSIGAVAGFKTVEVLANPVGEVVVTPFVNTDRLLDVDGRSEMEDLLPLADAQNKALADMMVGSEYYARPRRWASGIELEERPVLDKDGNDTGETKSVNPFPESDRMMISEAVDAKFGSLPAADLGSYKAVIAVLQEQISAVSALPGHYLGIMANQPASAEANRTAEASLTARAAARQATFGRSWERVMRHVIAVETGADPDLTAPEVMWADPATRSIAQDADAVAKLAQANIITPDEGRDRINVEGN